MAAANTHDVLHLPSVLDCYTVVVDVDVVEVMQHRHACLFLD